MKKIKFGPKFDGFGFHETRSTLYKDQAILWRVRNQVGFGMYALKPAG